MGPDKGLPLPDLTIYLTVAPQVASSRAAYGMERYETVDIQTRVRAQFTLVADEVRRRHGDKYWLAVDADGTIEQVAERLWASVEKVVDGELGEVGTLW